MRKHFYSKQSVTVSEAPTLFPPENRPGAKSSLSSVTSSPLLLWDAGAALGIGCRGAHPSLRYMTYGFLILLVFCKKCGLLVLVTRHFLVVHPFLNKILDPPLGWTLQRSRAGGKRCSSHVKEHLKASRFDIGEESRRKADPEQVAIDI